MTFKELLALAVLISPCLVCFIAAGELASRGSDGWGWFLFVGLLVSAVKLRAGKAAERDDG